jgi:hypothetical protein
MRSFLLGLALALTASGQSTNPRDFAVMAWGDSPSDPAQLRLMHDAGLNISGFCNANDLDRVAAAGLTCFVSDPRANGYDWTRMPSDAELRKNVADLASVVGGSPAVLGFYLQDEPHASAMPGMGKVAALLREALPGKWPYVNLFPYRVSPERMGTPTYDAYVRMLVDTIRQPFLSYDNYSLVNGEMLDSFFTNLEIVRRLGLETKTPFWNCILANSHFNYMEPSDATFNIQVYSTLAYGGRGIQYFAYVTPEIGNYRLGPIDQFGNKTATWDMLRRINNQIRALAPTMVQLRSTGVYHSPDAPQQGRSLSESRLVKSVQMRQNLVRSQAAPRFLVGEFEDGQGRPYFMIVNKDLANSFQFTVELKQAGAKLMRISPYSGKAEPFGREMDWLAPGAGVLLRVQ